MIIPVITQSAESNGSCPEHVVHAQPSTEPCNTQDCPGRAAVLSRIIIITVPEYQRTVSGSTQQLESVARLVEEAHRLLCQSSQNQLKIMDFVLMMW